MNCSALLASLVCSYHFLWIYCSKKKKSTDQRHGEIHVSPVRGHGRNAIRKHGGVNEGRQMMNRDQNSEATELDGMCTVLHSQREQVPSPDCSTCSDAAIVVHLHLLPLDLHVHLSATLLDTLLSLSSLSRAEGCLAGMNDGLGARPLYIEVASVAPDKPFTVHSFFYCPQTLRVLGRAQ